MRDPTFVASYDEAVFAWLYDKREADVSFCFETEQGARWGCESADASRTRLRRSLDGPQPYYFTGAFIDAVRAFRAANGPLTPENSGQLVLDYETFTYNYLGIDAKLMDFYMATRHTQQRLTQSGLQDRDAGVWAEEAAAVAGQMETLVMARLDASVETLPQELDAVRAVLVDNAYTPFLDLGMQWSAEEFDLARAAYVATLPNIQDALRSNMIRNLDAPFTIQDHPGRAEMEQTYESAVARVMLSASATTPVQVTLISGDVVTLQRPKYVFSQPQRDRLTWLINGSPQLHAARARVGAAMHAFDPATVAQADPETLAWITEAWTFAGRLSQ